MIAALGVSDKDIKSATLWLKWVRHLGWHPSDTLVVSMTLRAAEQREVLHDAADGMMVTWHVLPDEEEGGYPKSASHLFLRTLQFCKDTYDEAVLWLESDAIPIKRGWFQEIEREYADAPRPFMGHLETGVDPPHMAGVGVYPRNWADHAPSILSCLSAPDTPQWGRGRGQAFDTYCAHEIYPLAIQSRTIKQVWHPGHDLLRHLDNDTCLFHRNKNGLLIRMLSERDHPEFLENFKSAGHYDVVIPTIPTPHYDLDLRYTLRSIEENLPSARNIVLIGHRPYWAHDVRHIPFKDDLRKHGIHNVMSKLRIAVKDPDISEEFIFFNDDMMLLKEWSDPSVCWSRASGGTGRADYGAAYRETVRLLGYEPPRSYEVHAPCLFHKEKLSSVLSGVNGVAAVRTLYFSRFKPEVEIPIEDPKQKHLPLDIDQWPVLSTYDLKMRSISSFMSNRFTHPSRWEMI